VDLIYTFLGDAAQRCVAVLSTPPTSGLPRNSSFVQLQFLNDEKPQYKMVFSGTEESGGEAESLFGPTAGVTAECNSGEIEEIHFNVLHMQDSDDTDSEFSSLNSQPPSLSYLEEVNHEVTPIDEEEAVDNDKNDNHVPSLLVECKGGSNSFLAVSAKAGRKHNDQS